MSKPRKILFTQLGPNKLEGEFTVPTFRLTALKQQISQAGNLCPNRFLVEFNREKNEGTVRDKRSGEPIGYFAAPELDLAITSQKKTR